MPLLTKNPMTVKRTESASSRGALNLKNETFLKNVFKMK